MEQPLVSVIVPIFNRGFMLKQVLDCLFAQTYPNKEIILIDDSSTDNTAEIAKQYPDLIYILNTEQTWKGSAYPRNLGIKKAKGDIVLFTDSDVLSKPDLIETHVKHHLTNPNLIVQGQLVRIIKLDDAFQIPFSAVHYSRAFFDTANVSTRREWLLKAGGFDHERLPHGYEDLDLGLRLQRELGLKVKRMVSEGCIWHYEGDYSHEMLKKYFEKRSREGQAGVSFYRKHKTFEVQMMVLAHPFFYWLGRKLFNREYLLSKKFHDRVWKLINAGKLENALALVRFNSYAFYLQGMEDRIKKEGGL